MSTTGGSKLCICGINLLFLFLFIVLGYSQTNPKTEIIGDLEVEGKIKQSALPVDSQDVVTKEYMDKKIIQFGLTMGDGGIANLLLAGYSPKKLISNGVSDVDKFL